jgi:glycosyltransferase involved in cell wall biosynthesis
MRIAVVHPFSWPEVRRGGERYAHDLSWWLAREGHRVDYITGGPARQDAADNGVRLVRLHHRHGERLTRAGISKLDSFGATVLPWLLRHRYDVVHAFVPTAALAARLARQTVVYTAIGHPAEVGRERYRDLRVLRAAVRAAHVTTVLSQSAAAAAEELTGRRVRVVSPGVRTDVFTPDLSPRTGPPRLLFAAHAGEPRKRLNTLLAAMPEVLDASPDARLQVAGGGALPADLPGRVAAAVDVTGPGELADLPERYRRATVTVLPSVDEAFGLVLVESLACGTPVVASRSGGMPEIVGDGVGELVAPDDPGALAEAIRSVTNLAAEPATPRRCADHAVQWSWDRVGPAHIAAYELGMMQR